MTDAFQPGPTPAPDLQKKRELAEAARELMDNKAFAQAILELRQQMFQELMACQQAELSEFRARIRALEALPAELGVLINNYKMAALRKHG
jgi:hypothetical protein